MPGDEEQLQRLANQLDRDAPTISIEEIRRRSRTESAPAFQADESGTRRRWAPIVLGIAAATVLTAGVAMVLTGRSPTPTIQTGGTTQPDRVPTTDDRVPGSTTPATAPSTTTNDSQPDTTRAPSTTVESTTVSLDGDPAAVLAAIEADRLSKLRDLDGFTASVRKSYDTRDDTGQVIDTQPGFNSRTTMLADGSMWSELDAGGFTSYDATTGETRAAIKMPTGEMFYQVTEGWIDNSTGTAIMLGTDPAAALTDLAMPESFTVEEAISNRRPAWRITTWLEPMRSSDPLEVPPDVQTSTYLVDQATGLIVSTVTEWESRDGEWTRQASDLVDLVITDRMPDGFPGEFPDGVDIDRSGDPNAFRQMTLSEAAEFFGPGFVAPPELPEGAMITVSESDYEFAPGQMATSRHVDIRVREGFATLWTLHAWREAAADGVTAPERKAIVDGNLCNDFDADGACDALVPGGVQLANPELADRVIGENHGSITMSRRGVFVTISGTALVDARDVAERSIAW